MLSRSFRTAARFGRHRLTPSVVRRLVNSDAKPPERQSQDPLKEPDPKNDERQKGPELPKGLEGFFKQYGQVDKRKTQEQESSSKSQQQEPERNRKDDRRNDQSPPNNNFTNTQLAWLLASATAYIAWSSSTSSHSKEITWQEFRTALLDKGFVDHLIVVNKHQVRVRLRSNAIGSMPSNLGVTEYYFSIGSVDAFERKLEVAQDELGIPSSERIPVSYQDEISSVGALLNFAPTLLLIGVL